MSRSIDYIVCPLPQESHFDEIIDVRAPAEFAEDHLTGAINLPVLNDEERCRVGTIYEQDSPFEARKIGAALVSRNIAAHLESYFATKGKDYLPLIYCWRGGQRSGSLATVLNDIGWATTVIEGGYRTYRTHVIETISRQSGALDFIVLNGFTGAGKTLILKSLEKSGHQVLDLEALACHKGSVFGGDPESPQPAQKRFESLLFDRLSSFDLSRPVFIEAESAKIGRLNLPNPLWQRMKSALVAEIASPLASRAAYLTADYREWLDDPARVQRTIDRLKGFHADRVLSEWKAMSESGEWLSLVTELLSEHYDKRYSVGGSGHFEAPSVTLDLPQHDESSISRCAAQLVEKAAVLLSGVSSPW
jgi:tRNA 2-selenouridine synthase